MTAQKATSPPGTSPKCKTNPLPSPPPEKGRGDAFSLAPWGRGLGRGGLPIHHKQVNVVRFNALPGYTCGFQPTDKSVQRHFYSFIRIDNAVTGDIVGNLRRVGAGEAGAICETSRLIEGFL